MDTRKITIVRDELSPFEIKLAKTLKKKGFKVNSVTFHELKEEQKFTFDERIHFLNKEQKKLNMISKIFLLPRFLLKLRKIRKSIIIAIESSSNWFTAFFFFFITKNRTKIYFPYDIAYFRYKNYKRYPWFVRLSEKYNFRHCNGIMHKGPEDELKYLPLEFKALEKPAIQFLPYCDNDLMIKINDDYFKNKISKNDGNIHIVYAGQIVINNPSTFPCLNVYKEIIKQKIYIHVYPTNYEQVANDAEYKEIQKSKYFRLYKPVYGEYFQKEISKYDWGLEVAFHNFKIKNKIWAKTVYGNKISSHLEAGIPTIVNEQLSFLAYLIDKNKFGIVIKDIDKTYDKLKNINYKKMISDIKKNRDKFTLDCNIDRLINFIKDLADD